MLAIIPARGGSKRLPRKNVLPFRGRPIIAWTVVAAQSCGRFDRVVVSTDDDEIAAAGATAGAIVHRRPGELGSDQARVVDVCLDVLAREAAAGRRWPGFACLYATAPLRTADDIRATVDLLAPGLCDFAMAVTAYPLPPHQALRRTAAGTLEPMWPELVNKRASDLGPLYVDNGSTYAVATAAFERHRGFYGPGLRGHVMPLHRSVDIDTAEDFDLALHYAMAGAP